MVIEKTSPNRSGAYRWKCFCDCGQVCEVIGSSLTRGHTKSCGCRHRWLSSINSSKNKIRPDAAFRTVYRRYRNSAKERGIHWGLTEEQFRSIITQPCFYTNRPPLSVSRAASGEVFEYSGIDRLDSRQGYTVENCVPCCSAVNYAKRSLTYDQFLLLVREVVQCKKL